MNNFIVAKLFVSVLAISDTGSVSTSTIATDLPFGQCQAVAQEMTQQNATQVEGHRVTIRVKAWCEAIQAVATGIPPPVAGMLRGFLTGFQ